jgi:hypothetical protein
MATLGNNKKRLFIDGTSLNNDHLEDMGEKY